MLLKNIALPHFFWKWKDRYIVPHWSDHFFNMLKRVAVVTLLYRAYTFTTIFCSRSLKILTLTSWDVKISSHFLYFVAGHKKDENCLLVKPREYGVKSITRNCYRILYAKLRIYYDESSPKMVTVTFIVWLIGKFISLKFMNWLPVESIHSTRDDCFLYVYATNIDNIKSLSDIFEELKNADTRNN